MFIRRNFAVLVITSWQNLRILICTVIGCASCEYNQERIMVRLFVSLIVAEFYSCNELFRLFVSFFVMLIKRSLRNKHGEVRFRQEKKRQLCTCITLFCTFLWRLCTTTTWNYLISRLPRTGTKDNNFLFLFLNFDADLQNSTPKKFTNIWRIKRDGISESKSGAAQSHFLSDVFVTLAVVVA